MVILTPTPTDLLIEPDSGCGVMNYGYTNSASGIYLEDRTTAFITGQRTPTSEMTTNFDLNLALNDYQLIITGVDAFYRKNARLKSL